MGRRERECVDRKKNGDADCMENESADSEKNGDDSKVNESADLREKGEAK